ncbi:unnamed protein product, partial [Discosporangium mesarthrocarpum]
GKGGSPSPEVFMQCLESISKVAALRAATELRLFTRLGALSRIRNEGGVTAAAMAEACGCSHKGMRVLLDALAACRFVRKKGGPYTYQPTKSTKEFLDEASDTCVVSLAGW